MFLGGIAVAHYLAGRYAEALQDLGAVAAAAPGFRAPSACAAPAWPRAEWRRPENLSPRFGSTTPALGRLDQVECSLSDARVDGAFPRNAQGPLSLSLSPNLQRPCPSHCHRQPRLAHSRKEMLHQLCRLIRNTRLYPADRELRLLEPYGGKRISGLLCSSHLGQAGAAQALGALKPGAQTQQLLRRLQGFRISAGEIVRDGNAAEKHRGVRIQRAQPDRLIAVRDGFATLPGKRQPVAEITMRWPPELGLRLTARRNAQLPPIPSSTNSRAPSAPTDRNRPARSPGRCADGRLPGPGRDRSSHCALKTPDRTRAGSGPGRSPDMHRRRD